MCKFIKKNLSYLVLGLLSIALVVSYVFGISNSVMPQTYVKTGGFSGGYYTGLCYKISYEENQELDSVWINIGSIDESVTIAEEGKTLSSDYNEDGTRKEIVIFSGRASKESSDFSQRADGVAGSGNPAFRVENSLEGAGIGTWQKLYDYNTPTSSSNVYFLLATTNQIKINEIAFVGRVKTSDGGYKAGYVLLSATAYGYGAKGTSTSGQNAWYKGLEANSNTIGTSSEDIEVANRLIDNQDLFNVNRISEINGVRTYKNDKAISISDYKLIDTYRNLLEQSGEYSAKNQTPLSVIFSGLGTSVLGVSTLGVRLIALVFAIGLIVISYVSTKKLLKKKFLALIFSAVACGLSIACLITNAFTFIPMLFFAILSVCLMLGFVSDKKSGGRKGLICLLLTGVSFGLALAVNAISIIILIALVYMCIVSIRNRNKKIKSNLFADIICSVFALCVIPALIVALTYIVAIPLLAVGISDASLIKVIFTQHVKII